MRPFPFLHGRGRFGHRGMGRDFDGGPHRFGGFGRGDRRGFGPGGLRLVLLKLIEEKPSHGYELIKAIEDRLKGGYAPSPGIVYPALSWLEDGGLIVITPDEDNRKIASITDAGKTFLAERADEVERLFNAATGDANPREDFAPVFRAMENLKASLRTRSLKALSKTEIETVVDWIDDVAKKIERL